MIFVGHHELTLATRFWSWHSKRADVSFAFLETHPSTGCRVEHPYNRSQETCLLFVPSLPLHHQLPYCLLNADLNPTILASFIEMHHGIEVCFISTYMVNSFVFKALMNTGSPQRKEVRESNLLGKPKRVHVWMSYCRVVRRWKVRESRKNKNDLVDILVAHNKQFPKAGIIYLSHAKVYDLWALLFYAGKSPHWF